MFDNNIHKCLETVREWIPEKYNHVKFLDYLDNPKVDAIFSISTRGDGKTFSTFESLAYLNLKLEIKSLVIMRHWQLRLAMVETIQNIYKTVDYFKKHHINAQVNFSPDVITILVNDKPAFYIVDLNNAQDLKQYSQIISNATITVYDEFLAINGEYSENEFQKFKTIFESMDRGEHDEIKYLGGFRKAIFLGNPVDFSSEFLSYFDIFPYLQTQKINTVKQYGNIVIELRRNSPAQENKNNRIFKKVKDIDTSITGDFNFNLYNVQKPNKRSKQIIVKLDDNYLKIYASKPPILEITPYEKNYSYNVNIKDNSETSIYLDPEKFLRDDFIRKYEKGKIKFANNYSKNYILDNYPMLDILKVIKKSKFKEENTETLYSEYDNKLSIEQIMLRFKY